MSGIGAPIGNSYALRHGDKRTNSRPAREYVTYYRMKDRCLNPRNNRFQYYGARGVKICERWLACYDNFIEDMGRKPSPEHSLDRIDTNGNYEPGNCRWATRIEQRHNRRDMRR